MSRWGNFEAQVQLLLQAMPDGSADTIGVASTEDMAEEAAKGFPAVYAIWNGADARDPVGTLGSKIHPQIVARLKVVHYASTGEQDAKTRQSDRGLYALMDKTRAALLGKSIKGQAGGRYPLLWQREDPLEKTAGNRLKAVAHYTIEGTLDATVE